MGVLVLCITRWFLVGNSFYSEALFQLVHCVHTVAVPPLEPRGGSPMQPLIVIGWVRLWLKREGFSHTLTLLHGLTVNCFFT